MASTYTRRINLYINGKEVKNDISSIKKEMRKLTNEQNRMTIGSRKYVEQGKKINALKNVLRQHNAQLNQTKQKWISLKATAQKFNSYFSMITAGAAAVVGLAMGFRKA
ncbi:MAG: hypothetical protein HQ541_01025, partial [Mariniphaga sp.]|nr:hypothetical protein [Mariniphaga sp.]